ncbi:MAG: B12-binding domain-containing radical SAM protein [Planctomycetes bacterium]|nr:B12-binding domain-containing radical SAM protein [Planctomycetota bacterium]
MPRSLPSARFDRVVLIQPPVGGESSDVSPPIGLLLLAAILQAEGRSPSLIDLNLLHKQGRIDPGRSLRGQYKAVLPPRGSVDLVGITTWSYNFGICVEIAEEVRKRNKSVPIVIGGPHATFVAEEALETFPVFDYALRDEGDETFPQLIAALESGADPALLAQIPGLTWRRGTEVVHNPSGGVVEDLDSLPFPAYDLIEISDYLALSPVQVIEAGRGCPYNCNFCSTTNMFQRKYRTKSASRLVDEVEWAMEQSGANRFELLHDNLVAGKKFVLALCAEIRERNLDIDWSCTSRTDNITEPLAQEMFLAGCSQVFFGVESLSPERQAWTGKKLVPAKIEAAIRLTARQHILPTAGIIVGFPDETEAELDATVGAALRWASDPTISADISTATLRYYPGADLFARADELRYDPIAAAFAAAVPDYKLRESWRNLTGLFPLHAVHTKPAETRLNLTRVQTLRTLLAHAPLTARACIEVAGLRPSQLLDELASRGNFTFLKSPHDRDLLLNEVARALGDLLLAHENPYASEILATELPFWQTRAVAPDLNRLEHVIHEKLFVQDALEAYILGARSEPPPRLVRPHSILGIRAGRECVVAITEAPDQVLQRVGAQLQLQLQQARSQSRIS